MTPAKIPHLCGGILFGLLCEAKKTRRKAKDKLNGGSDGLTIPNIYAGLIHIVTGDDLSTYAGTTLKKCATNYRTCVKSTGEYVPFTNPANQSAFDAQYKKKNPDLLERMSRFIGTYLNEAKCEWLVRALIETMQAEHLDIEIAINYTENVKASDLHTAKEILFLPFLLSILHYVVMECPDCESGRLTFESWYSQSGQNTAWKFNSNIGNGINPMNVSLDLSIPPEGNASSIDDVSNTISDAESVQSSPDTHSDCEVIVNNMGKALQPVIDALEAQKNKMPSTEQLAKPLLTFAAAAEAQEHELAEKIRSNENNAKNAHSKKDMFEVFKTDSDNLLKYCIEKDPTGEPISLYIPDQISNLIRKWNFEIRKIQNPDKQRLVRETLQTLSDYLHYLSDRYLKAIEGERLIFRNSSIEEGNQLCNELRPNTYRLRCKLRDLYLLLWPAPTIDNRPIEDSSTMAKSEDTKKPEDTKGTVVHQTIVNQYGDHPVHIDHVENLKL